MIAFNIFYFSVFIFVFYVHNIMGPAEKYTNGRNRCRIARKDYVELIGAGNGNLIFFLSNIVYSGVRVVCSGQTVDV